MPANSGIAGFTVSKSAKYNGYFSPLNALAEFGTEPRLARLHARSCTPLNLGQFEVIWYVVDGLDAQFLQFLFRAGV